jgi:hypothetical protein
MGDTKRGRERSGKNKREQRRRRLIRAELEAEPPEPSLDDVFGEE